MAQHLDYRRAADRESDQHHLGRWSSRSALLIAIIALSIAGVLLYVGQVWPVVLYRLGVEGSVAVLWLAGAIGMGVFVLRLAKLWEAEWPSALRWTAAAGVGLGLISLLTLGLGLIGALNAVVAWAMLAVGWVLGVISLLQMRRESSGPDIRDWLFASAGWNWLWIGATPFLVLAVVSAMVPPGMLWTPEEPHGYDVVEYHLQIPREWFEAHRIVPLHHNVFSFFPFNVEMHYLLAMHLRGGPWAGMYLAQLMHMTSFALTILAVYGLARVAASRVSAAIAALSLLSVPWITQLAGIAYDEGGFLFFGILAIGIAMIAIFDPANRVRRFVLAGAMAGFAAGSKLTAVPEVLVAVPIVAGLAGLWLLVRGDRKIAGANLWGGIILFGVTGLLCFSPWLVRNIAWSGNPVFPELLPVLGHGDFSQVQVERFEKAHKPPPEHQSMLARLDALNREVLTGLDRFRLSANSGQTSAWQFGYLILPLGLCAFALSVRRPQSWCLLGLLLALTLFWLLMTHLQSRFFLLAAPISALLIAQIRWQRAPLVGVLLIAIFAGLGWARVNAKLYGKLYGTPENAVAIVSVLGMDGEVLYPQLVHIPDSGKLFLIGDARAFLYTLPMSRLRYRTVFDVKEGPDIVQAWLGGETPAHGDHLQIDPRELRRFHKTYFGLPPLTPEVENDSSPLQIDK